VKHIREPYAGPGERFWFVAYTVASFVYRAVLYVGIILFIAGRFFIAGVLLALWAGISMVVYPALKRIRFVATSPVLRTNRGRAVLATLGIVAGVLLLLFAVPFPYWTRTEGIVWVPEEALVRAGTNCFVGRVVSAPNSVVEKGALLVECNDPAYHAEVRVLEAKLAELSRRYEAALPKDLVEARILQEAIGAAKGNLERAQQRRTELDIRSPADGVFVVPGAQDLPDRFLKQGDLIAYVLNEKRPTVRVVVQQADVDLVRQRVKKVAVRLKERLEHVIPAVLVREVPGAVERLPSTILGASGGGNIAVDPRDAQGGKALEKMFQFDLELDRPVGNVYVGGRVYVRFDHGLEPVGFQWYRTIRQMFLRRFHV
jgi:putative peptide zinc metalloprotease protein